MPDILYAIFNNAGTFSLRKSDPPGGPDWDTLVADLSPATCGSNKGAWDGTYYYFSGGASDRKLYRFDPSDDTFAAVAGGAAMTSGSNVALDLVFVNRGGNRVYYVGTAVFGYYDIDDDSFTALTIPNDPNEFQNRMAWDGGQYLFVVGYPSALGTRQVIRYDLDAEAWESLATPPNLTATSQSGAVIANDKLYFCKISGTGAGVYSADLPDCATWGTVYSGDLTNGSQANQSADFLGDLDRIYTARQAVFQISTLSVVAFWAGGTPTQTPISIAYTHAIPSQFPDPPTDLSASSACTDEDAIEAAVVLTWTASPSVNVVYDIYRNGSLIASGVDDTEYTDTVTANISYVYRVNARNVAGSAPSEDIIVTPFCAATFPPFVPVPNPSADPPVPPAAEPGWNRQCRARTSGGR